jgi:hypothetical protein
MDDVEILSEPLRKVKVVGQWNVRNQMSAETNKKKIGIGRRVTKGITPIKISKVSFLIKGIKMIICWSRTYLHCCSPRTEKEQAEARSW